MTSNQINAALAREELRHNLEQEKLSKRAQEEVERQNKINNILKAAQNVNDAAQIINQGSNQRMQNQIAQQQANTSQLSAYAERKYKQDMTALNQKELLEAKRHNMEYENIQMANIKHLDYQDKLQSIRDEWQRNVDVNMANYRTAEITIKSTANTINQYLAEIDRARVDVSALQAYSQAIKNEYEMALMNAQTDEARARIVTNYINATTNLLNGVLKVVSFGF